MTDDLRLVDITETQLDDVLRVRARSFGLLAAGAREDWVRDAVEFVHDGRFLGVVSGDEVVAAARIWDFQQWWGGRRVPMAGIAGVVVAPEYRGRGVGSLLMRGVLERSRDKGMPISALYPATTVIYRHLGYEFGGHRYRFSFQAADLRSLGGREVAVRRAGAKDAARFLELVGTAHEASRASGLLVWPESKIAEWLEDEENFAYLAEDGFVVYNWSDGDLQVDELVAHSEATARALWATVGSGASIARTVHAYLSPNDPVHLLVEHEADKQAHVQRWMLRLLDAPAAIAARGFAPGAAAEVDLLIDDPGVPAQSGRWHLSVADGTGELTPSDRSGDVLQLGSRGLAALYAGTPLAALRTAGLVTGGPVASDRLLDTAFGGAAPYMLDYF
ncbi:GCN5-related N-acetyltransferase [Kribbella flavida DSM 17836]|uniref:GCN5-related N-acetyltransferase n=1 Tax=Kribbella flavida (strain DSM 17836 / JCM 10339 / NBRC 14399) TaxID=479435 RepID=D2PVF8_KRIFD|nr:GNAT family N-acetyltransferase [Kribbella flavida]ADB33439.1 GCN5-related N-acetyltransferase [Kribbella flavida DSM 17836]